MPAREPLQFPAPLSVRLLAVLMTCVMSGLGLMAMFTGHVEGSWTRYGYKGPLEGATARHFGLSIFLFGLLPLMLLARSPRSAKRFAVGVVVLALLSVFFGVFVWR